MTNYRELVDRIVGPQAEDDNDTTTPPNTPQPNSYSATDISVNQEFAIEEVKNGSNPDQIKLKLAGFGWTIEGIGGVNYGYVVINHRGQKEKFLAGSNIE